MAAGEFRCRICYAKRGRLRHLSHLEVTHALDRAVRRAGLPYAVTQGFNPHMKVAFGPALPTGTAGEREYLDIWLTEYVVPEQLVARLSAVSPPDLTALEARYVGMREPSLASACTIALYEVSVTGEGVDQVTLQQALAGIVSAGELVTEHKGKAKVFDLAQSLPKEPSVRSSQVGPIVELTIRVGQLGSLRPDVLIAQALAGTAPSGVVTSVTRCDVLVETDEGWRRPI